MLMLMMTPTAASAFLFLKLINCPFHRTISANLNSAIKVPTLNFCRSFFLFFIWKSKSFSIYSYNRQAAEKELSSPNSIHKCSAVRVWIKMLIDFPNNFFLQLPFYGKIVMTSQSVSCVAMCCV